MGSVRNILFIMCDQLRADYLSCGGHPSLKSPNLDALAEKGVLFTRAYCNVPICGGSRMSYYTGRYSFSHGATWNGVPLPIGEVTMGEHLRAEGVRTYLLGKSHFTPDLDGMARVGLTEDHPDWNLFVEGGFEIVERDDGFWEKPVRHIKYNDYLKSKGYVSDNPVFDFANSAEGQDGEILSGWHLKNSRLPARVKPEDSETAYYTGRAMEFIAGQGDTPWCLHLSYNKPHWPYMAPAPYNDIYGPQDMLPLNRTEAEKENAHPVLKASMERFDCRLMWDEEAVRHTVLPYMGLIKEIDDHMGRLFAFLNEQGRMEDTLIVFTSDHGDYLGDHWLGEKEFFHEEGVRVPLIVYDPDPAADANRGTRETRFVESVDMVPTFIEAVGGTPPDHIVEGRSILPLLRGGDAIDWREFAVTEHEYGLRVPIAKLGIAPREARAIMIRTENWKYVHHPKFRPELFDLENDPKEQIDLGASPDHGNIRDDMRARLLAHLDRRRLRTTITEDRIRLGSARTNPDDIKDWQPPFGRWV